MSKVGEVVTFISKCDKIIIVSRKKNAETRRRLGITVDDQEEIIRSISSKDYISGPETDYNPKYPGDIYIFRKFAYEEWFYIKIKMITSIENTTKVISCHIAEHKFDE